MTIKRPTFKPNVKAILASTANEKRIMDFPVDSVTRVRVFPRPGDEGEIYYRAEQHFGLKYNGRNSSLACLNAHGDGTEKCPTCEVIYALMDSGDEKLKELGKKLVINKRFYAQIRVVTYDENKVKKFSAPKIVGFTQKAANDINAALRMQEDSGDDLAVDINAGQDFMVERKGAMLATRYNVMATGKKEDLDVLLPNWADDFIHDIPKTVNLNILTRAKMVESLKASLGDVIDIDEVLGG